MIEARTKLNGVYMPDFKNKYRKVLAFELTNLTDEQIKELEGKDLMLKVTEYRKKRSLDSNAYMWLLTSKIATKVLENTEECHRRQMRLYAPVFTNDEGAVVITLRSKVDIDTVPGYWRYYDESEDGRWKSWMMLKSSHEFDSKEMSIFLRSIIAEAKELGIETATPDELEKMRILYESKHHS